MDSRLTVVKYTVEEIPVGDLEIDRRVQRGGIYLAKVEDMKRNWNPHAVGIATVSRRSHGQQIILDGAHRWTVLKELTDNQGTMICHVFIDLSSTEEAETFLALNNTTKPLLLDKFRVRVTMGDIDAVRINDIAKSYGWEITRTPGNHHIQAVGVLEKIWDLSKELEADPDILSLTMLVVTRAWGTNRSSGHGAILEGVGQVIGEHHARIDIQSLIVKLSEYKGGAATLHAEAAQLAGIGRRRVAMCVAELVVEQYNRGRRVGSNKSLPRWSRRS